MPIDATGSLVPLLFGGLQGFDAMEVALPDASLDELRVFSAAVGAVQATLQEQIGKDDPWTREIATESDRLRELLGGRGTVPAAERDDLTRRQALTLFRSLRQVHPTHMQEAGARIALFGTAAQATRQLPFSPSADDGGEEAIQARRRQRFVETFSKQMALPDLRSLYDELVEAVTHPDGAALDLQEATPLPPNQQAQRVLDKLFEWIMDRGDEPVEDTDKNVSLLIWGVAADGLPNAAYATKLVELWKADHDLLYRNRENRFLLAKVVFHHTYGEGRDRAILGIISPVAHDVLGGI